MEWINPENMGAILKGDCYIQTGYYRSVSARSIGWTQPTDLAPGGINA